MLILENKTNFTNIYNFLALPEMKKTIAVFGKGFQLNLLKDAQWLVNKRILYWGDIDCHGFQILSQLRFYFPQTRSLMMDRETFETFTNYCVEGAKTEAKRLPHLTPGEQELFAHLLRFGKRTAWSRRKSPTTTLFGKSAKCLLIYKNS